STRSGSSRNGNHDGRSQSAGKAFHAEESRGTRAGTRDLRVYLHGKQPRRFAPGRQVRRILKVMEVTRRGFFLSGAATLLSRNFAAATPEGLITLSPSPKDLEMPAEDFIDEITPVEHFFVRCHTLVPQVHLPNWKLEIAGLVEHPLSQASNSEDEPAEPRCGNA